MIGADAKATEAEVGLLCDDLAVECGWTGERYEQRRNTKICRGLPDRRYVHRGRRQRIWVELKRPGGKLTADQHAWLCAELDADGYATCVDDVEQLLKLFRMFSTSRVAQHQMVHAYCCELVRLTAARGFRAEAK